MSTDSTDEKDNYIQLYFEIVSLISKSPAEARTWEFYTEKNQIFKDVFNYILDGGLQYVKGLHVYAHISSIFIERYQ